MKRIDEIRRWVHWISGGGCARADLVENMVDASAPANIDFAATSFGSKLVDSTWERTREMMLDER